MSGASPELLTRVTEIARRAGRAILELYASEAPATKVKEDASPLTAADLRAHRLILAALRELTPDWPVLSEEEEEGTPFAARSRWPRRAPGGRVPPQLLSRSRSPRAPTHRRAWRAAARIAATRSRAFAHASGRTSCSRSAAR